MAGSLAPARGGLFAGSLAELKISNGLSRFEIVELEHRSVIRQNDHSLGPGMNDGFGSGLIARRKQCPRPRLGPSGDLEVSVDCDDPTTGYDVDAHTVSLPETDRAREQRARI